MIAEWWSALDLFMKILWGIAIATSLIFLVETVLTFIGIDHEMDTDFDVPDGSFEADASMNLYTFRNLVNFLLGMSWTAILTCSGRLWAARAKYISPSRPQGQEPAKSR